MSGPVHLFREWDYVRKRARRASRLALLIDFDGTLVPIRRRPGEVRLAARTRRLLRGIARRGACVGVISGRALDDIRRRVAVPGIWYVGAHGAFIQAPGGNRTARVTRKQRRAIARVREWLAPRLDGLGGVWLEDKSASLAVHHRGATRRNVEFAELLVTGALATRPGLHLMTGKKVWEILPDARLHKWSAVQYILRRETRGLGRMLAFYLGDDTTDEQVFRHFRGISVFVGAGRHTRAQFFLKNPAEVAQLLEQWKELENERARATAV